VANEPRIASRPAPDEIARQLVVAGHVPRAIGGHHAEQRLDIARLERIVRGLALERIGPNQHEPAISRCLGPATNFIALWKHAA